MASIHKKGKGRTWYVSYRQADKLKHRSLYTTGERRTRSGRLFLMKRATRAPQSGHVFLPSRRISFLGRHRFFCGGGSSWDMASPERLTSICASAGRTKKTTLFRFGRD